jgi:hypothetical protein
MKGLFIDEISIKNLFLQVVDLFLQLVEISSCQK